MNETTKTLIQQLSANGKYEAAGDLIDAEFLYIQAQEDYLRAVQTAVETLKTATK